MKLHEYPFSAIVGQESMKTALILNAVDASIGGVLIRGHKGTGKSTAARSLARLLPEVRVVEGCPFNSDPLLPSDCEGVEIGDHRGHEGLPVVSRPMPFVELPLNATEDRLIGSLHIEKALRTGRRSIEPGLLAAANRGILYVDEVNLLDDHLVDLLLDAAASGVNVIEREGISFSHAAHFILIGTMNPEEGQLRPQFLDRFGLCADVQSLDDLAARELVVRSHLAFESDPEGFLRRWEPADRVVSQLIASARERLREVKVPDEMIALTVRLTQDLQTQGHRADITIMKAARAHAALLEKGAVDADDVGAGARLALVHRMKSAPLDTPETLRRRIEGALRGSSASRHEPEETDTLKNEVSVEEMQVPGAMAAGSILFSFLANKRQESIFEPDREVGGGEIEVEGLVEDGAGAKGRARARTVNRSGRYSRAAAPRPGERHFDIALDATLRQAALRQARRGRGSSGRLDVQAEDLRKKVYSRPCDNLIVFVVDSSESMGAGADVRMKAAKGAVLAILRKAYQNRSAVAMVAFGGERARVVLPPTSSVDVARRSLERLPTGGATPFADGLVQAWRIVRSERLRSPGVRPMLVVVSDGEANVPITEGVPPLEELGRLAERIGRDGVGAVFIDAAGKPRAEMRQIAARMRASYVTMRDLTGARLLKAIPSAK